MTGRKQRIRGRIKKLLSRRCPGFKGAFTYYGTKVYFPKGSIIFQMACDQGIYEHENVNLILALIKPNTFYFDVGANIGLMAIPILHTCSTCTVVSIEPSQNNLPYLIKTVRESRFSDRWLIIDRAIGSNVGEMKFVICSSDLGAFDGFLDTKRAGPTHEVIVPVTTLDTQWESMGQPKTSMIKVDVEGAELQVLQGALNCIEKEKPHILIEWNLCNLKAYGNEPRSLITFAESIDYRVFSVPNLLPIRDALTLQVNMLKFENYLLVPK